MAEPKSRGTTQSSQDATAASVAMPAGRSSATITFAADGCVMGHWQGISIVIWGTPATMPLVGEFSRLTETVGAHFARGSSVQLVVNGAGPPTAEARAALWGLAKRSEERHICSAFWIEDTGFRASVIRSIVTSLDLVTGRRLKLRSFTNLDELAAWVIPTHRAALGLDLSPEEFVQVLGSLRAHPVLTK